MDTEDIFNHKQQSGALQVERHRSHTMHIRSKHDLSLIAGALRSRRACARRCSPRAGTHYIHAQRRLPLCVVTIYTKARADSVCLGNSCFGILRSKVHTIRRAPLHRLAHAAQSFTNRRISVGVGTEYNQALIFVVQTNHRKKASRLVVECSHIQRHRGMCDRAHTRAAIKHT